jgi:acetolactate synthase-1/2/3 large subunit
VSEERSGASILVESLVRQGVEFVFGYPGGAVLPIYDALFGDARIRHILVRHEAGRGPCRRRLCPLDRQARRRAGHFRPRRDQRRHRHCRCLMDSIPMVVITGQVPTGLIGTDAFQEADTIGITGTAPSTTIW